MIGRYRLLDQLDLPGETFPGQVLVEIAGDNRVLIEHHKGVIEYTSEQICVSVQYGIVQICGNNLELRFMTKEQLIISGRIDRVVLTRRSAK